MLSAVLHVAVEKNIVLTVAQVGLSKLAILPLRTSVVVHAGGHSHVLSSEPEISIVTDTSAPV